MVLLNMSSCDRTWASCIIKPSAAASPDWRMQHARSMSSWLTSPSSRCTARSPSSEGKGNPRPRAWRIAVVSLPPPRALEPFRREDAGPRRPQQRDDGGPLGICHS
jgi:hypothetical protein